MAKNKVSRNTFDKEIKRLQVELCPVPERHPCGPDVLDEVSFKHSVPELF